MKKDIIPIFVAVILIIVSIFAILLDSYIINIRHYIGFSLIAASLVLYFKRKDIYFYIFGITLIAGALGFVEFFFLTFGFRIGIFQINPLIGILLLIFIIQNRQRIFPMKKEIKELDENQITTFQEKYRYKSEHDLTLIADQNSSYVKEARIAAENLLKNKNVV